MRNQKRIVEICFFFCAMVGSFKVYGGQGDNGHVYVPPKVNLFKCDDEKKLPESSRTEAQCFNTENLFSYRDHYCIGDSVYFSYNRSLVFAKVLEIDRESGTALLEFLVKKNAESDSYLGPYYYKKMWVDFLVIF